MLRAAVFCILWVGLSKSLAAIFRVLSLDLRQTSHTVGLPLFFDFDISRYMIEQYSQLLLPPIGAWYLLLRLQQYAELLIPPLAAWFLTRRMEESFFPKKIPKKKAPKRSPTRPAKVLGFLRSLWVGIFIGVLVGSTPLAIGATALIYAGMLEIVAGFLAQKTGLKALVWRTRINLIFLPIAILTLPVLSAESLLNWFPWWAGAFGFLALEAVSVRSIQTQKPLEPREKILLFSILAPIGTYLVSAQMPGVIHLSGTDFFHVGEHVLPASFLVDGRIPWRDFLFVHGLLEDCLAGALGMWAWGKSIWAAQAGQSLWLNPLLLASLAFFYQRVFRDQPIYFAIVLVLLISPAPFLPPFPVRFALVPLCLLALLRYLEKPDWSRAGVLSLISVVQLFLTPEFFFFALSFGAVTLISDLQSKQKPWNTLTFGGLSLCIVGLVLVVIASFGSLAAFFDFYLSTAQGHKYTGGSPQGSLNPNSYTLLFFTAGVCLVFAVNKYRARDKFSAEELTFGALFLFLILYFQKFVARADNPHLHMVWGTAVPLFFYVCSRLLTQANIELQKFKWSKTREPLTLLVFLTVIGTHGRAVARTLSDANVLRREADFGLAAQPGYPELGPVQFDEPLLERIDSLGRFFAKADGAVFDFTGQPLLFHFLLGLPTATRFPYVSLAIHPSLQEDLVEELDAAKPEWVIFDSKASPLARWDEVPNMIRHHKVSSYLLSNYTPVAWVKQDLILRRKTIGASIDAKLYETGQVCDWGAVLSYWATPAEASDGPPVKSISVPSDISGRAVDLELTFRKTGNGTITLNSPGLGKPVVQFRTKKADRVKYRVPLGSCPLWHTSPQTLLVEGDGELVKATWKTED